MMPEDLFKRTIDEVASRLWYLIFYFQGEPISAPPGFWKPRKYASRKGIYTATSTNAHYLTDQNARRTVESGLDRLIISLDGTTQEVYQQYRVAGKLEKVLEGTRNVVPLAQGAKVEYAAHHFPVSGGAAQRAPD